MEWLKHNWVLRFISLALAVVLWYYVRKQEDILRRTILLPISIAAPAGERVVEPPAGSQVRVDLEGPAEQVRAVENAELKLNLDIGNVQPGKAVQVPVSVEIPPKYRDRVQVSWRPLAVSVRLVSDAVREFPVLVQPLNHLDGWQMREVPRPVPDRVTVSGPLAAVDSVKSVVAPFRLEQSPRVSATVNLQALSEDGADLADKVRIEPPQVQVTAIQEHVVMQKRVPVQPRFHLSPGTRVTVDVLPPRVRLVGSEQTLARVYLVETDPVDLAPGQREITREVSVIPPGAGVDVDPPRVRVTLRLIPAGR